MERFVFAGKQKNRGEQQLKVAIFKANYTRIGHYAKGSIRYIESRRGERGAKITRTLFGLDGVMDRHEAYSMINDSPKGSVFFRFIVSPDPKLEDTQRDLDLREITQKTMALLEERIKKHVQWVGAVHADHTPHRHVHIVAVLPKGARINELDLEHLRLEATQLCLEQRRELDRALGQAQEGERLASSTRAHSRRIGARHRRLTKSNRVSRKFSPSKTVTSQKEGGLAPARPQMCTCTHCGNRQEKPYLEDTFRCVQCGSEIRWGKKISLYAKSPFRQKTQEAEWVP